MLTSRIPFSRNDALYEATTTTTTTTSTQAPPPTTSALPEAPLRRPGPRRPLRRRRPQQDYYYDDEEYDDEYVEERVNRRRKPNRQRRPEYVDEYENPRTYKDDSTEDDLYEHRPMNRARIRDNDEDDYEYERRQYERPRNRNRPAGKRRHNEEDRKVSDMERRPQNEGRQFTDTEKRKSADRRPLSSERRPADDRRATAASDNRRPLNERRRGNNDQRRPAYEEDTEPSRKQPDYQEEFDDDRSHKRNSQEDKVEITPKVRSSSSGASIFNRSRVPPKINRPVPVHEKSKFQYVAKPASASTQSNAEDELYDDEYDYENEPEKAQPAHTEEKGEMKKVLPASSQIDRRPIQKEESHILSKSKKDEKKDVDEDEYDEDDYIVPKAPIKENKNIYQRPTIEETRPRNAAIKSGHVNTRQSPANSRDINKESLPEDDEDDTLYDESPPKSKDKLISSPAQSSRGANGRLPITSSGNAEVPQKSFLNQGSSKVYRPSLYDRENARGTGPSGIGSQEQRQTSTTNSDEYAEDSEEPASAQVRPSGFRMNANNNGKLAPTAGEDDSDSDSYKEYRPVVRVLKRPFLPSRGGNPYLPRGLKPLGGTNTESAENSGTIDIGTTTSSGARILEHSPPIVRPSYYNNDYPQLQTGPRTTHQPQIEPPRSTLDEIFNEEYDVTLNDALNPTLKPLSQTRGSPIGFSLSKYDRINPYARSDVSHSPSLMRSTALHAPLNLHSRPQRGYQQPQQQFYDEELEY